jgi:hypothetical protein
MHAEVAKGDAERKRIITRDVIFVADVNVAYLDLDIVDDLRREFFSESLVFFGFVLWKMYVEKIGKPKRFTELTFFLLHFFH